MNFILKEISKIIGILAIIILAIALYVKVIIFFLSGTEPRFIILTPAKIYRVLDYQEIKLGNQNCLLLFYGSSDDIFCGAYEITKP